MSNFLFQNAAQQCWEHRFIQEDVTRAFGPRSVSGDRERREERWRKALGKIERGLDKTRAAVG